jgi:hypothetical protein
MNDRLVDEQFGALVGARITRQATSISARPDDGALFARIGARAARQRRLLAAAAVVAVTVASITGYAVGTTNFDRDASSVRTPVADSGAADPSTAPPPLPGDAAYEGPLEHVFTRTTNGITLRVYLAPASDPRAPFGSVIAEMSSDAAVGVGRAELCPGSTTFHASGTFGGPEGAPVEWVMVPSYDLPSTTGPPVRAVFGGGTDEMVPVRGIAVLVAPGTGGTVHVAGPAGAGTTPIGLVYEADGPGCQSHTLPPVTLPPPGPQPADVAAAEAGVRQAYVDVYDNYQPGDTDPEVRKAALDNNRFTDEQLTAMTVEVGEIRFTDETHAAVLFRLTIPGHLDGSQDWRLGYAVLLDGRWTQAPETRCEDLRFIGLDCPEEQ